jgi:cysteine-rich repeat protein
LPSNCAPICGDGRLRGAEACDDGDVTSGDGCSTTCAVEAGFTCEGEPSNCIPTCGDGFIRGGENCDDGNTNSDDGCSGEFCRQESGRGCVGQPSVCVFNCGNGHLDPDEECDDGDTTSGDGCNDSCQPETGYACFGQPSVCVHTCGNGILNTGEQCDDGNTNRRDGCDASCRNESGWLCGVPGTPCQPFEIFIDSPAHGIFTTANSVTVTGHYTTLPAAQTSIKINGVPASSVNTANRTFSHTVALNGAAIFNPVLATLTNTANGDDVRDRITVIKGPSIADGALSPQSVAMRINDTGLDTVEPLVAAMAGSQLNLAQLIPPGTVLADECFINVIGCWGSAKVSIGNPAPSFGSFGIGLDTKTNAVGADIAVRNLRIDIDIDGSGLVPDCGLRLTATQMSLNGDYALEPTADRHDVDVNLVGAVNAGFTGFNHTFTYGLCGAPIIGDIIQAFLPDIQQFATDGIKGFIGDPDGAGPADSPIADAMETTLAGISISGAVGSGLGMNFDAPLFKIAEDPSGITFGADASFTVTNGTGPGQCIPPPGTPNFTASYAPPEPFPGWGANTPLGNAPYGIGLGFSSAAFNQLLRGQTECGLMRTSLATIDLDGQGGAPPVGVTSSLLALLIPEFGQLPADTPLRIDIAPTLAPVVTGAAGPGGELTELKLSSISVDIVEPATGTVWLSGAFDVRLGLDMDFLPDGSGLAMTINVPEASDTTMTILYNPLGTDEAQLETLLPSVFRPLIPDLAGALSGFPIPQFFGLKLQGVEVSKNGSFLALFANLTPTP